MKKVLCVLLVLALVGAAAYAAIDLSGMSFEELLDLRAQVDAALWASDGWQEVTVPMGVYYVGEDIPAGRWTVDGQGNTVTVTIFSGDEEYWDTFYWLDSTDTTANINLKRGQRVEIASVVVFKPYTGAALGFK